MIVVNIMATMVMMMVLLLLVVVMMMMVMLLLVVMMMMMTMINTNILENLAEKINFYLKKFYFSFPV